MEQPAGHLPADRQHDHSTNLSLPPESEKQKYPRNQDTEEGFEKWRRFRENPTKIPVFPLNKTTFGKKRGLKGEYLVKYHIF
jgi:hypothetical protein